MRKIRVLILALMTITIATGCNLSASKPPTAFTFPTPDLTGTAIYSKVATSLAPTPSPTGGIRPTATVPAVPTATTIPAVTATSAPVVPTSTSAPVGPTATLPPLVRTVGKVVASYLGTPPIIDGDLSKWTLHQYPANSVVFGAANWVDAKDLSATVMLAWDNNNLYLGVHVTDDKYVQNATGANLYKGDSLEVLIDTNLQADFYVDDLSPDDFQLVISPGKSSPGNHPEAYLWYPTTVKGTKTQVQIAAKGTDSGYDVEVAIPWSLFEVTPVAGKHYGFAFSVSDNDNSSENVQQSMVSTDPNRHLTDPTTWGDLTLAQP